MNQQMNTTPDSETPRGQRNWFLLAWLGLIVLWQLFNIISWATGGNALAYTIRPQDMPGDQPAWPLYISVACALGAIVSCGVLAAGNRKGFLALALFLGISAFTSLFNGFNIGIVLATFVVLIITYVLIMPRRRGANTTQSQQVR